eukprot:1324064-Amorphochlora_amoeboformis.AAC.1
MQQENLPHQSLASLRGIVGFHISPGTHQCIKPACERQRGLPFFAFSRAELLTNECYIRGFIAPSLGIKENIVLKLSKIIRDRAHVLAVARPGISAPPMPISTFMRALILGETLSLFLGRRLSRFDCDLDSRDNESTYRFVIPCPVSEFYIPTALMTAIEPLSLSVIFHPLEHVGSAIFPHGVIDKSIEDSESFNLKSFPLNPLFSHSSSLAGSVMTRATRPIVRGVPRRAFGAR